MLPTQLMLRNSILEAQDRKVNYIFDSPDRSLNLIMVPRGGGKKALKKVQATTA
jgi:hypothetical protein